MTVRVTTHGERQRDMESEECSHGANTIMSHIATWSEPRWSSLYTMDTTPDRCKLGLHHNINVINNGIHGWAEHIARFKKTTCR